jgi:hypothetical protein
MKIRVDSNIIRDNRGKNPEDRKPPIVVHWGKNNVTHEFGVTAVDECEFTLFEIIYDPNNPLDGVAEVYINVENDAGVFLYTQEKEE